MGIDVLAGLLDDKLIRIISVFLKNPEKRFYLSEVSKISGINAATTFRILNKLGKENLLKIMVLGKVRTYQLSKGERATSLAGLLKKGEADVLDLFCDRMPQFGMIKFILLDSRTHNSAKLIIVGNNSYRDRIERVCDRIEEEKRFKITFVELTPVQYNGLKGSSAFNLDKKIIYRAK